MPRTRLLLALPAALALIAPGASAQAATLAVNSTVDASDANPGNGICATGGGVCTLRAAIQEAGSLAGADTITLPAGNYQLGAGLGTLVVNSSVTINGGGARTTTVRAASGSRVFQVAATATLRDLTITGANLGSASSVTGGGVRVTAGDLTLERVTVAGNQIASSQVAFGAGIGIEATDASLTLLDSTVTGNTSTGGYSGNNQGSATGGGIFTAGPAIIKRSTIEGNIALGGTTNYASGGGAHINGLATIEQSTFAGNSVATIADSSGFRLGGNLNLQSNAAISGTILAGGSASVGPDCYRASGVTVSEPARNLESKLGGGNECLGAASLRGVDPKLGGLTDNGGPTDTLRPAADSPAIDAAASCGSRTADQRGNTLFGGLGCDLGAVEVAASRSVTLQSSKSSAAAGDDVTLIAKIENAGFDQATGESLTLTLPAGMTATTVTTSAGSCTVGAGVSCALGALARGTAATVIVTARASGTDGTVTAARSGAVPDQNAADDQASVLIGGIAAPQATLAPGAGTGSSPASPAGAGAAAPQADTSAPAITGLALRKRPRATVRKGAALTLALSEAASVRIVVEQLLPGRRTGKACTAKGRGKRCTRARKVASLTRTLPAGSATIALGRRQLRAGKLRVTVTATDAAGNRSAPAIATGMVRR